MKASREDLAGLIQLQHMDLEILKQKKAFDELPQRKTILEARKKKAVLEEKMARVLELKKNAQARLARIETENASLDEKAQAVQDAIEQAQGDYRNVEARTKELDGIAKRREALVADEQAASADMAKIEGVEAQIVRAVGDIEKAESEAIALFQTKGGDLRENIARLEAERGSVVAGMSPEIVKLYEKTAARAGGVAVGILSENRCGVCRSVLEGGRLIDLKAQAPLGTCPTCKRMLIIG